MKVTVIWEGIDIKAGVAVKDRDGCVSIICETNDAASRRWTLYRLADSYVMTPMAIESLISFLNAFHYVPKELCS